MLRFNLKNQEEVKALKLLHSAGCIQGVIIQGHMYDYLDDSTQEEFSKLIDENTNGEEILAEEANDGFLDTMVELFKCKTIEVLFNKVKLEHPKMIEMLNERSIFINKIFTTK